MQLVNRDSGARLILSDQTPEERSLWLLKRRIKHFDRLSGGKGLRLSFLTVTQSDANLGDGSRWITGLMHSMKQVINRAGFEMYYVAVLEIQPKRYLKYGVLAPHWHVAIGVNCDGALPHAVRLENGHIQKERDGKIITWDWLYKNIKLKFGMYFCCDCWSHQVFDYLGKYLAKGDLLRDFIRKVGKKVRVFSSSRFPVEYEMSWIQKRDYQDLIADTPEFADLYWRCEGSRIVGRAKNIIEHEWENGYTFRKVVYEKVHVIKGEWVIEGTYH